MIVTLKKGVQFDKTTAALGRLLSVLLMLPQKEGWPSVVVITSGSDGQHSPNSRHYVGDAIDVRSHNFSAAFKEEFRNTYEQALGPQFRVLLEYLGSPNEHFHAQVRKGHTFDPEQP